MLKWILPFLFLSCSVEAIEPPQNNCIVPSLDDFETVGSLHGNGPHSTTDRLSLEDGSVQVWAYVEFRGTHVPVEIEASPVMGSWFTMARVNSGEGQVQRFAVTFPYQTEGVVFRMKSPYGPDVAWMGYFSQPFCFLPLDTQLD